MGELQIPLPPLPLQRKFAALVDRVERLRAVPREALRQAEHLFSSLLGRAFNADRRPISDTEIAVTAGAPQADPRRVETCSKGLRFGPL